MQVAAPLILLAALLCTASAQHEPEEHGLQQREVRHGLQQREVQHGLQQREVRHGLQQREVQHGLQQREVQHGLQQREVQHGLQQREVRHGLQQREVQHGLQQREVQHGLQQREVRHGLQQRQQRDITFRPVFVTRQRDRLRQQQRRRMDAVKQYRRRKQQLQRQGQVQGQGHAQQHGARLARALQFPVSGEPGMALKVSVNDLLFRSAPTNDLPDLPDAQGGALRPMLLAKLRAAQLTADRRMDSEVGGGEEAEAFLLLSANGGKPAIVPAPGSHLTKLMPAPPLKSKVKVGGNKSSKRSPYTSGTHKRVTREAPSSGSSLGHTLLDMVARGESADAVAAMVGERARIAERVKQYNMQGTFPSYSYTHGRYTRSVPSESKKNDVKLKLKVSRPDDDDDDEEDMEAAQSVVFRPLFAYRERQAVKQRRRMTQGLPAKKPVKPIKGRPSKVRGYPVRYPLRRYSQPMYYVAPYRRVIYYH